MELFKKIENNNITNVQDYNRAAKSSKGQQKLILTWSCSRPSAGEEKCYRRCSTTLRNAYNGELRRNILLNSPLYKKKNQGYFSDKRNKGMKI